MGFPHMWRSGRRLLCVAGCLWMCGACGRSAPSYSEREGHGGPVRLALALQPSSALAILAVQKDFFDRHGVRVTVEPEPSGKRALERVGTNGCDAATTSDVPVALAAFERDDFVVVAEIASSGRSGVVVARKDRIATPADLKGKRLATQRASVLHFAAELFLFRHGLSPDDVTFQFHPIESLGDVLESGAADAIVTREPELTALRERLGEQAVVFEMDDVCFRTEVLVVSRALAAKRPETVAAMIAALLDAEAFARDHPAEAQAVVRARLGMREDTMRRLWPEQDLTVELSQALLTALEDEALWAVRRGLVGGNREPNYLNAIWTGGLPRVAPDRMTLIR